MCSELKTQLTYVLISGRWFRARSADGPWEYVPGSQLPPDFARIPEQSRAGLVLASIPGTPQAQEAVIANSISQTATVNRSAAHFTAPYDGSPNFVPITGTSLQYAVNSPTPIIRVDKRTYYSFYDAVWFVAAAPTGPWTVAISVPGVIYTIPVTSPLYYVTYVWISGSTPIVVYVGYTPGYLGTVVTPEGVVVYGTGLVYPAYVGTVWYPPPPTYGYGAGFSWGATTGFLSEPEDSPSGLKRAQEAAPRDQTVDGRVPHESRYAEGARCCRQGASRRVVHLPRSDPAHGGQTNRPICAEATPSNHVRLQGVRGGRRPDVVWC